MRKILFVVASVMMMLASCTKDNNVIPGNNDNGGNENAGNENAGNNGGEVADNAVLFNELCGNKLPTKFIELYNNSDAEVSLAGWTIRKYASDAKDVEGKYNNCWVAPSTAKIAAGGYLKLDADQEDPSLGFNAGLSAKKEVKFELVDATGKVVDKFLRGQESDPFAENGLPEKTDWSFSRVPNGTGEWAYAVPTPGAANGAKVAEIEHE